MRIAIVCGHFVPAMGYVEVHLAKVFSALGHNVRVITSTETSSSTKNLNIAIDNKEAELPFEIKRLKPSFSYGQIIVANGA